ncbi:MAG: DUF6476 family protein [Pseudomonadota bacterium]
MRYVPEDEEEPPKVRRLRLMTMSLMGVLMVGFVFMVAVIVIKVGFGGFIPTAEPALSKAFGLPRHGEVVATGQGKGTVLFLIRDSGGGETLWVHDSRTGDILSQSRIVRCSTPPCDLSAFAD